MATPRKFHHSNIDCTKFIPIVREHRVLWDRHDKNYYNKKLIKQEWEEVANEMDLPVEDVKKRWSGLRDHMRKELKKISQGEGESKWVHYPALSFLEEVINLDPLKALDPLNTTKRRKTLPEDDDPDDDGEYNGQNRSTFFGSSEENESETDASIIHKFLQLKQEDPDQNAVEKRGKHFNITDTISTENFISDPDVNFLLSLVPHLQQVPANHKITVQQKLLQVLTEYRDS